MTNRLALVLAAAVVLAGCRPRVITKLERDEAANVISEAEFAATLKDWSRAEGLYARAAALCPDQGETWVRLGIVRVRLHDSDGARSAYKSALSAFKDDFKRDPANTASVIRGASVLVILGRADEARSLVDKAYEINPGDGRLRNFVEMKGVDKIIADPGLKEVSP
jgi:Flp pilus assembly protein TadD